MLDIACCALQASDAKYVIVVKYQKVLFKHVKVLHKHVNQD